MAQAITWRNLTAPSFGSTARFMEGAGDSLSNGLDSLQALAESHRKNQLDNWGTAKQRNTDALLGELNGASTLDTVEAIRKGLGDRLQTHGAQIDSNAIWDKLNVRTGEIRDEVTSTNLFQDSVRDRNEQEGVNTFYGLLGKGDLAGAGAFLEDNKFRDETALAKDLQDAKTRHQELSLRKQSNDIQLKNHNLKAKGALEAEAQRAADGQFRNIITEAFSDPELGDLGVREKIKNLVASSGNTRLQPLMDQYLANFEDTYKARRGLTPSQEENVGKLYASLEDTYAPVTSHYDRTTKKLQDAINRTGQLAPDGDARWKVEDVKGSILKKYKLQDAERLYLSMSDAGTRIGLEDGLVSLASELTRQMYEAGLVQNDPSDPLGPNTEYSSKVDMRLLDRVMDRANTLDSKDGKVHLDMGDAKKQIRHVIQEHVADLREREKLKGDLADVQSSQSIYQRMMRGKQAQLKEAESSRWKDVQRITKGLN